MTEHLPECAVAVALPGTFTSCICEALRACEERVSKAFHVVRRDDMAEWGKLSRDQFDAGYAAAVIAAVQRVEAYEYISPIGVTLSSVVPKAAVIAAIKGDQ